MHAGRHADEFPSRPGEFDLADAPCPVKQLIAQLFLKTLQPRADHRLGDEHVFGSFGNVFLKPAELRKLQMDYTPEAVSKAIEDLSCKLADGSQQSDNHCATLRYWLSFRRTADTSPKGKMEAADEIKRQTEQILGLQ